MEPNERPSAPEPDEVDPPDSAELEEYLEQVAADEGIGPDDEDED